jgi:hypothetical protein
MRVGVAARTGAAVAAACVSAMFVAAASASASGWLPHPADATWTYQWTDSVYATDPTTETLTVDKDAKGTSFALDWTNADPSSPDTPATDTGTAWFQDTNAGLFNPQPGWSSSLPPSEFPTLCATITQCGNSLASALYNLIWGSRAPVLFEPLLQNEEWDSTGGYQNDVTGSSLYMGTEQITVPAFPQPVLAAKVQSQITQAGALGDPYGSGVRTTWWVYGVGPVKIVFTHGGGSAAPVTTVLLQSTNQTPQAPPPDVNYFPYVAGAGGLYQWTNKKYFKKPEVEKVALSKAVNGTALFNVSSVSGPLKVAGSYEFTTRLDGVTSVASATQAASLAMLPPLGPSALPPSKRRHFFTPLDLMTFGFNPIIPAYPKTGDTWTSNANSRDFAVYGVAGSSRVVGVQSVKVPAGTFQALVVSSVLKQPGFPFGSGTRTVWLAPGKGLVKLVFRHGDGSVSTVQLISSSR